MEMHVPRSDAHRLDRFIEGDGVDAVAGKGELGGCKEEAE